MPLSAEGSAFVEFVYRMVQDGMTDDDLRQELRNYDIEPYLDRMSKILEARNADLTKKMIQSHLWADPDQYGYLLAVHGDDIKRFEELQFDGLYNKHVLFIDPDYMKNSLLNYLKRHCLYNAVQTQKEIYEGLPEKMVYVDRCVDEELKNLRSCASHYFEIIFISVHSSEEQISAFLQTAMRDEAISHQATHSAKHLLYALGLIDQKDDNSGQ